MADSDNFAKLVPGFEFLQGLVKNAGSALPSMGQWVAPTLNPEELEKRIEELRTVQFWLEQNARMLAATIQALEVQRMTLSTLKTMNVQMSDLQKSLTIRSSDAAAPAAGAPEAAKKAAPAKQAKAKSPATQAAPSSTVDPMQWWGALTKQFTELAASALKDPSAQAAQNMAGNLVKKSVDAAQSALQSARDLRTPAPAAKTPKATAATAGATKRAGSRKA